MKKKLFLTFLKIGAFTFGGGYAMIPLIKREIVEEKKWITEQEMLDMIAVAESTPGPLAVNAATFVGSHIAGTPGALAATTGVVLPSFLIILLVSKLLTLLEQSELVSHIFTGIRAGVLVLVFSAFCSLLRQSRRDLFTCTLIVTAFLSAVLLHLNTILILFACAIIGILRSLFRNRRSA